MSPPILVGGGTVLGGLATLYVVFNSDVVTSTSMPAVVLTLILQGKDHSPFMTHPLLTDPKETLSFPVKPLTSSLILHIPHSDLCNDGNTVPQSHWTLLIALLLAASGNNLLIGFADHDAGHYVPWSSLVRICQRAILLLAVCYNPPWGPIESAGPGVPVTCKSTEYHHP